MSSKESTTTEEQSEVPEQVEKDIDIEFVEAAEMRCGVSLYGPDKE